MKEIKQGSKFELQELVTIDKSAAQIGSGLLEVYSTPSMIALIEKACFQSINPYLDSHESSVGGALNIRHHKPTALGKIVTCQSEITSISGKKIEFKVEVFENEKMIGSGTHTRFVIDTETFVKNL